MSATSENECALKIRSQVSVLVIARNGNVSNQIRACLKNLGFSKLSAVGTHVGGLDRIKSRSFQLVIFDAVSTDMAASDFVREAIALDGKQVLIALSAQPQIDDVFGLLRAGSRGYVVSPFTIDSLEMVISRADEGPPFSEAVLQAPDRNAALVGLILNNLYRLSVLMRQAREYPTAVKEARRYQSALAESVDIAKMFCEKGDEMLLRDRIIEDCIGRANTAASRLGRTRQKLQRERVAPGAEGLSIPK